METKRIVIPQETITKEQEKSIINAFVEALPADSYLAAIFKTMVPYCESEIDNDFGINPLETIASLRETVAGLESQLKSQQDALTARHKELQRSNDAALSRMDEADERAQKAEDKLRDMGLYNLELKKQKEHLAQEVTEKDGLITKLKAQLYDYLVDHK